MTFRAISPKQRRLLTWWCDGSEDANRDAVICDGAVRSGKTLFMGLSFVFWAMARYDHCKFGLCGKTVTSLRRNVVTVIVPVLLRLGFKCTEKVSASLLTVSYCGRTNEFYMFGGRDESSASLIQGITFAGVYLDEAALMPESFVNQACARCSVQGSKMWFNCNPEGPNHWFYREWIEKANEKNALHLHFTMNDNPSLTPEIRARYESMYSGVFYERFILGKWVCAEGRVYDFFNDSYVQAVPEGTFEQYFISCDYGTVNPTSMGLWGKQNGVWYRMDEYYYDSRLQGGHKTDEEYADALERLCDGKHIAAVIVDPSAASFIEVISRRGFRVLRAKNDVIAGIRVTQDLLKSGKLVICSPCRDAIREFSLYVWDENAESDAVVKKFDHAMDEIRYFANTVVKARADGFAACSVERRM